jgi:hypothetical protein
MIRALQEALNLRRRRKRSLVAARGRRRKTPSLTGEIWLPDSLKSGHGYTRVSRISTDEICTIRAHPCPIERETKVRRAFTAYQSVSIRSIRVNPCTARSKVSGDQRRNHFSFLPRGRKTSRSGTPVNG